MKHLRTIGKAIYAFLPHLLITGSIMALTFYFINRVNEAMNFLTARISTGFQSLYFALTILTVALALLLRSKAKWVGLPAMLGSAVLFVPVFRAFLTDNPVVASETWYQTLLMLTAFCCLPFAVVQIILQRKAAKAAYLAAIAQNATESPQEEKQPVPASAN
ncbi:MAG: hypothetical protein ACI4J3_02765 [Oscillospiraceae bacterium]